MTANVHHLHGFLPFKPVFVGYRSLTAKIVLLKPKCSLLIQRNASFAKSDRSAPQTQSVKQVDFLSENLTQLSLFHRGINFWLKNSSNYK